MPSVSDDIARVYAATSPEESAAAYAAWAARYDGDNLAKGFFLPFVAAGLLARHLPRGAGPVLDAGCGTGLVGAALSVLGYDRLIGLDLSAEMLGVAVARGCYGEAIEAKLGTPLPIGDDAVAGSISTGAFGPGHAPAHTLDELVRVTRPGGPVVFNTVTDQEEALGLTARIAALEADGRWRRLEPAMPFRPYLIAEPELVCTLHAFVTL